MADAVTIRELLLLLLLAALLGGMLSIVLHSLRVGISPMPTSRKVRARLLALVPEELEGTVLELGSGWGTLAFPLAERCRRARVLAYESSPLPFAFSWLRQRLSPRPNLELRRRDLFEAPLAEASLIVCYLYTGGMARLGPRLREELSPGARVLSHTFALRGWRPREAHVVEDVYRTPIYLYERDGAPPGEQRRD